MKTADFEYIVVWMPRPSWYDQGPTTCLEVSRETQLVFSSLGEKFNWTVGKKLSVVLNWVEKKGGRWKKC